MLCMWNKIQCLPVVSFLLLSPDTRYFSQRQTLLPISYESYHRLYVCTCVCSYICACIKTFTNPCIYSSTNGNKPYAPCFCLHITFSQYNLVITEVYISSHLPSFGDCIVFHCMNEPIIYLQSF